MHQVIKDKEISFAPVGINARTRDDGFDGGGVDANAVSTPRLRRSSTIERAVLSSIKKGNE